MSDTPRTDAVMSDAPTPRRSVRCKCVVHYEGYKAVGYEPCGFHAEKERALSECREKLAALEHDIDRHVEIASREADARVNAEARVAEFEKDAERYRWWRKNPYACDQWIWHTVADIDDYIDAALRQKEGER